MGSQLLKMLCKYFFGNLQIKKIFYTFHSFTGLTCTVHKKKLNKLESGREVEVLRDILRAIVGM